MQRSNLIIKISGILLVFIWFFSFFAAVSCFALAEQLNALSEDLYLSASSLTLKKGETYLLHAIVSSSAGAQNAASFLSGNSGIASVDSKGLITAAGLGETKITVTLAGSNKIAVCSVKVMASDTEKTTVMSTTVPTTTVPVTTVPVTTVPVTTVPVTTVPAATVPATAVPMTTEAIKEYPIKLSETSASVYSGNHYFVAAECAGKLSFQSSNSEVATVTSGGVVYAKSAGKAIITVSSATHKTSCTLSVINTQYNINLSHTSINVPKGKTFFLESKTDNVKWKSGNESVAYVKNGLVEGKKTGVAVVTAYTQDGARTCLVNISTAEPIRFAYATPNSASVNEKIQFVAITDKTRSSVKFEVKSKTDSFSVTASQKIDESGTYVWIAEKKVSVSGVYEITAYSKQNSTAGWETCSDGKASVFVSTSSRTTETNEQRYCSDEGIAFIADYEGFLPSVEMDILANVPNIGYGVRIYPGDVFYNGMTKREGYAHFLRVVKYYEQQVSDFFSSKNVKYNQNQFDSMVSFSYNLGPGILTSSSSSMNTVLLSSYETGEALKPDAGVSGYINACYVNLRQGPSLSDTVIRVMDKDTQFSFLSGKLYESDWYNIQLTDGTKGYVYKDYASVSANGTSLRSLKNVDTYSLTKTLLQYHHVGYTCIKGLLNRRVDELEMFLYGDYKRDGSNNKYKFEFTCASNWYMYI